MRYYDIQITNPTAPVTKSTGPGVPIQRWTTWVQGPGGRWQNDPGALDVEFDLTVTSYAEPQVEAAWLRVWGVPLNLIGQASNFSGMTITMLGGMRPGLPLATAQAPQAGVLVMGMIYPAFGNWIGVDQTLDFLIIAGGIVPKGVHLSFNWMAGQSLATVLQTVLQTAFPNFKIVVNISPLLITSYDQPFTYGNIVQLAKWVKQRTADIIGSDSYHGVDIAVRGTTIIVVDDTTIPAKTVAIAWQDLIGQPTWLGVQEIQIKTVLRGDIGYGDLVTLPNATLVTNTKSTFGLRTNLTFQGSFKVIVVRHVGHSRQPDGGSWCSIFNAVPQPASVPTTSASEFT